MINVNNTIKTAYSKSTTQADRIILNGNTYRISNVIYEDDCYEDGNIFGTAIARNLEFDIESGIDLEAKEFEYQTGILINGSYQWISLGNFITYEMSESDNKNFTKIQAMDYMLKSNIIYTTELDYSSGNITLLNVIQEACTNAGIVLETTDFVNNDFIVDSNQFEENALIRDVIKAVAQISGSFAKIKNDNKLYFITPQLDSETVENITTNDYANLELKRNTHPINLVSLGMSDVEGENVVLRDEESIAEDGENSLIINDNPFAYTQDKRVQLITDIFDTVDGFEYTAFEIEGPFKPYLEVGDRVIITDLEGNTINSFLFRFTYKSPKGLESEMSAPSIIKATVDYQNELSALDLAKRTELRVNKDEQKISEIIERVEGSETQISNIEHDIEGIYVDISKSIDISEQYTDSRLEDYSTTEDISTMIDIRAGEIELELAETHISTDNLIYNSVGENGTSGWKESENGILSTDKNTSRTSISKRAMKITTTENSDKYVYTARFNVTSEGTLAISGWTTFTGSCHDLEIHLLTSTSVDATDEYNATEEAYTYDDLVLRRFDFDVITLNNASVNEVNNAFVYEFQNGGGWLYFEKIIKLKSGVKSGFIKFISGGANINGNSGVAYLGDLMVVNANKCSTWGKSTKDLLKASSDAVTEAVAEAGALIDLALVDYPTQTEVTTQINAKAGEIETTLRAEIAVDLQSYVTSNDLSNTLGNYSTTIEMQNYVSQTTASFEQTISTEVTMQIGEIYDLEHSNLVYNSVGMLGTSSWGKSGATLTTDYDSTRSTVSKRAMVLKTSATTEGYAYTPAFEVKAGTTYAISGYVYLSDKCSSIDVIFRTSSNSVGDAYSAGSDSYNNTSTIYNTSDKGSWKYFSGTYTIPANMKSGYIRFDNNGSSTSGSDAIAYLSDLMVVEGSTVVSWNVSSKDIQKQVTKNSTSILQTSYEVGLKLDSSDFTSAAVINLINNRDGTSTAKIAASNIELSGYVTVSSLSSSGSTNINGDNITTGTINADRINMSSTNGNYGNGIYVESPSWLSSGVPSPSGDSYNPIVYFGAFDLTNMSNPLNSVGMEIWENGEAYIRRLYCESGAGTNSYMAYIKTPLSTNGDAINYITCTNTKIGIATYNYGAYDIYYATSDENLKKNIIDADLNAMDYIKKIRHIEFDWKESGEHQKLGFSAQQLRDEVCSDFVASVKQPEGYELDERLQVRDFNIMPYLTKAIQELNKRLEVLENERN